MAQMVDEYLFNQPILEQVIQATILPATPRLNALITLMQQEPNFYVYQLFNEQTAREFLHEHYAPKVLRGFQESGQ